MCLSKCLPMRDLEQYHKQALKREPKHVPKRLLKLLLVQLFERSSEQFFQQVVVRLNR